MEISVWYEQAEVPVTVVRVKGIVNSEEPLQSRARELFEAGTRNILLDLSNVPYTASAGLRALHYIYDLLRTNAPAESSEAVKRGLADGTFRSPHLKLLKPTPKVLDVLHMAGYDMFLEIHQDLQRAVESVAGYGQAK